MIITVFALVGVTFNSERNSKQDICGTIFAFNDQDIRIWAMSGESFFSYVCLDTPSRRKTQ